MKIATKFNPFDVVCILRENKLVACTVTEVITSSTDSGRDNQYITKITYKLRPHYQYGTGLPPEIYKPENEVWKDNIDFIECMTEISQNINSK